MSGDLSFLERFIVKKWAYDLRLQTEQSVSIRVEDNAYDYGYWSRMAGEPLEPSCEDEQYVAGWNEADTELKAEERERIAKGLE